MALYAFEGLRPVVAPSAYIHPDAVLIGNVRIGGHCFIGAGAVLRGDFGPIRVRDGSNVQENCVVHVSPGQEADIHEKVVVGHGALLHDVTIRSGALIGMGAVLLHWAVVEPEGIVAPGAVVRSGFVVPARTLVSGNPAQVRKDVPEAYLSFFRAGVTLYPGLPDRYRKSLVKIST